MNIEHSVFKIITDHNIPNWESPWVKTEKYQSSGTGFCIAVGKKKYILTNCHCVENAVLIKAFNRQGSGFSIKVDAILYECDMALLSPVGGDDLKDVEPLRFRRLPNKLEKVRVVGYPLGGYNISISAGIVNRVVMVPYMNIADGIALQIDAAINFGNSGGPVIDHEGYVVGIAFSTVNLTIADNMGFIIPTVLINFFIASFLRGAFPNGKFMGLGDIGINTQDMHNKTLRKIFDMKSKKGVLIVNASGNIKNYDILLEIDGHTVNNDGTMRVKDIIENSAGKDFIDIVNIDGNALDTSEVLPWKPMVRIMHAGDKVSLKILRDGVEKTVKRSVQTINWNIPQLPYHDSPRYYTVMGMIFVPLTRMLIQQLAKKDQWVVSLEDWSRTPIPNEYEYVVLADIYIADFTEEFPQGYYILDTVGGIAVRSLIHLEKTIDTLSTKKDPIIFTFKDTDKIAALEPDDIRKFSKKITSEYVR